MQNNSTDVCACPYPDFPNFDFIAYGVQATRYILSKVQLTLNSVCVQCKAMNIFYIWNRISTLSIALTEETSGVTNLCHTTLMLVTWYDMDK